MKIEIDLKDILTEEYGPPESLAESIHRQIVEQLKLEIKSDLKDKINQQIDKIVTEMVKDEADKQMPAFLTNLFDTEYTPTDRYGDRKKPTTFRSEMLKTIQENMVWKPESDYHYRDRENAFTKMTRSVVDAELKRFQNEFDSLVTSEFTKQTIIIVTKALQSKFGLKP